MSTTRAQLRTHIGRGLGRSYYVSSTTTAASTDALEVVDKARTEHDSYWNGATILISSQEVPLRGGAGTNTNRTPNLFVDRALSSTPAISTNYEILRAPFNFTLVNEAIDDTLERMWPHFYDPIIDESTVEVANDVEYNLTTTWKDIYRVEREIQSSSPTRYYEMTSAEYEVHQDSANPVLYLKYIPVAGRLIRIFARAVPTIGSTDAGTTEHPASVIVQGALEYLFRNATNGDIGATNDGWRRRADLYAASFERLKRSLYLDREARQIRYPVISVGT